MVVKLNIFVPIKMVDIIDAVLVNNVLPIVIDQVVVDIAQVGV